MAPPKWTYGRLVSGISLVSPLDVVQSCFRRGTFHFFQTVSLRLFVHDTNARLAAEVEAQRLLLPPPVGTYSNPGRWHYIVGLCGLCVGVPLQPHLRVGGQVSTVKAARYIHSLAQLWRSVAELLVLQLAGPLFASDRPQLPHGGLPLQGLQGAQQHGGTLPWEMKRCIICIS